MSADGFKEHFIAEVYEDFRLSRQAMNCTPATLEFYHFTVGKFVEWLSDQGITICSTVKSIHVRGRKIY